MRSSIPFRRSLILSTLLATKPIRLSFDSANDLDVLTLVNANDLQGLTRLQAAAMSASLMSKFADTFCTSS
jgi:hypothetical protein